MPKTIVLGAIGAIGADGHAVGNEIIERVLTEQGFKVVNLGAIVSQDEFIDAAIETHASAVLVSPIHGRGGIDGPALRGRCVERGLEHLVLYVGGDLVLGQRDLADVERLLPEMGFDHVFPPSVDLREVTRLLRADIAESERRAAEEMVDQMADFAMSHGRADGGLPNGRDRHAACRPPARGEHAGRHGAKARTAPPAASPRPVTACAPRARVAGLRDGPGARG